MRTLVNLLIRYYFFIIFLVLEAICFVFIYQSSYYQRYSMISMANEVTGSLNKIYTNFTEYLHLERENERLAEENAFFRSLYKIDSVSIFQNEKIIPDTAFRYINAKVISNSINKRNNYFIIDKGWSDGIEPDMGVVSLEGVAGIIVSTSRNFATGMSLLHKDARISSRIKKNGQLVSTSWAGRDYTRARVTDIPTHISLLPGDTIVTSGNSLIFPEGIIVGFVEEFNDRKDRMFNEASIVLATDFNRLYHVYVIRNLNRDELIDLSEKTAKRDE